ncbi:MAG: TolB family protein [Solirubrobacterales bacterium]
MSGSAGRLFGFLLAFAASIALFSAQALASFPGSDGSIAFSDGVPGGGEAIFEIDPSSGDRRQLTTPGTARDYDPAWSADGSLLAFTRDTSAPTAAASRIMILERASGIVRELTPPDVEMIQNEPTFSPDGARIGFVGRPPRTSFLEGVEEIFTTDLDGGGLAQLTESPGVRVGEPSWSPRGGQIAYSLAAVHPNAEKSFLPSDVFLLDLGLGTSELVTRRRPNADDDDPSWRPDGRRLLYERERSKGPDDIALIRPNGKASRLLIRSPSGRPYRDPSFSPSARKIALYVIDSQRRGIAIYDLAKRRLRFLTSSSRSDNDWQPLP